MSDKFYIITSNFGGSFWTYIHTLKSDVINGRSPTDFVFWAILFGNVLRWHHSNIILERKGLKIFWSKSKAATSNISMVTWFGSYLKYAHVGGPKSHKICLHNIWMVPYMQRCIRELGMTWHFYQSHIHRKVSCRTLTLLILSMQSVSNIWQPLFYMMLIIIVNGLQVAT